MRRARMLVAQTPQLGHRGVAVGDRYRVRDETALANLEFRRERRGQGVGGQGKDFGG